MVITFLAELIDAVNGISAPLELESLSVIKLATLLSVISVSFRCLTAVLNPMVTLLVAAISVLPFAGRIVAVVAPVVVTVKVADDRLVSLAAASSTAAIAT